MAHLSNLPTEVLYLMLAQCDSTTLHSLSLVSRPFHHLSNRFLYSNIDWIYHHDERQPRYPPLTLLLRTLLAHPELALLIKRVHLDNHYLADMEDHLEDMVPGSFDLQTIDAAMDLINKMGFPQKDRWYTALSEGSVDAVIALILSQLENLETLKLALCLVDDSVFVGMVLKHLIMVRGGGSFSSLRYVKFGDNVNGYDALDIQANIDQIIPCFFLSSLEELIVTIHEPDLCSWPTLKEELHQKQQSQSLTTLRLYRCDIDPKHVEKLVMLAPRLKVLHCGFLRHISASEHSEEIDFADLRSALLPAADTLEELTIDMRWTEKNCDVFSLPLSSAGRVPMGSLQQFHILKRLDIPTELLLGNLNRSRHPHKRLSDLLPPSLQSLGLVDNTVTWESSSDRRSPNPTENSMQVSIDALAEYLRDPAQHAPFLRDIVLNYEGRPWEGHSLLDPTYVGNIARPTQPQLLRRIAEASGVAMSVFYTKRIKRGVSTRASIIVYDPENPDAEPIECGPSSVEL
ncbi:hypothetical protein Aspvir_001947 [Aspergillus viridinutans]|uniref:F-box domain-containing protein n=1 Tax=Aspergillus viridinutans TaxID=75553 RepID=A0A9P3C1U3_ASPVI|nr:uncharacterized protein Aspvir_001947 [Aspergillus viridinutans]GIK06300.1 hypothetical protein Aspvir_001947 [Aspergillus viridinutans]